MSSPILNLGLMDDTTILREIAATDDLRSVDWVKLRDVIKSKIEKNIALFLATTPRPIMPAPYLPVNTPSGGLKLPPFLPRKLTPLQQHRVPVSYMNPREIELIKSNIFTQLDMFESNPPFTIQRLCELVLDPKKHYKTIGKYLRAVEKSVLVTSPSDAFPPLTDAELHSSGRSAVTLGSTLQSAPSTPLFSPIPFLHDDARRSKSRSPPPTPLTLNPTILNSPAIGLVDELDDPSPGHMSDRPTPLTNLIKSEDVNAMDTTL